MELFIIRHGQSVNNALEDQTKRKKDPALTSVGEQQAEELACFLGDGRHLEPAERENGAPFLDCLYCSAMFRALKTALPIGKALSLNPEVWVNIHEKGGIYLDHRDGRGKLGYPGMTRSQILEQFPHYVLPEAIGENGWWNRDFEEFHLCHSRAIQVARELEARSDEDIRIGLVTHVEFINSLLKAFGNQLPGDGIRYMLNNTGVTRIGFPSEEWIRSGDGWAKLGIYYLNRLDHLPEALIT